MNISGHTKPYAVLGHPIGHTLSPIMHNAAFAALRMDAVYIALDVAPERLINVLESMKYMGFGGINLTVPLKEIAFKGLPRLDDSAKLLGAVNTVRIRADGLTGFNTDGYGFVKAIEEAFGFNLKGASLFVAGTGGAGRAVALTAAQAGAAKIVMTDVDRARSENVGREIAKRFPNIAVTVVSNRNDQIAAAHEAALVVQATPVGMKKEDPPVLPPEAFRPGQFAFDLIYMFSETAFMKSAKAAGAKAANGLGMLLHQGARAFGIWTEKPPPIDVMRAALERAVYTV